VIGGSVISLLAFKSESNTTIKDILLAQFKTTHTDQQWFVTMNNAVKGLTAEQATWKDENSDHSVGQLAHHLVFWNTRLLKNFLDIPQDKFEGENTETFDTYDKSQWESLVAQLDSISTEWEKAIENADDAKLEKWYSTIANINTHNAYHTGQILYIRKMKGWWNPDNGVK